MAKDRLTPIESEEESLPRAWSPQLTSGVEILVGLGLLILLIGLAIWVLQMVITWAIALEQVLPAEIWVAVGVGAVGLLGLGLMQRRTVADQMRRDLRDRRAGVYREIVKFYLEIMLWEKLGKEPKTEEEVIHFHARVTPQLLMWASDPVIKRYAQLRNQTLEGESNSVDLIFEFEKLFLAMRKDLGHSNRGLRKGDVLSLFVKDITQYVNPLDMERVE